MHIETLDMPDLAQDNRGDSTPSESLDLVHRYLFARHFAQGRTVLDISSNTRCASALLSQVARSVTVLSKDSVTTENSRFELVLDFAGDSSFIDLKRVLSPAGVLIASLNIDRSSAILGNAQRAFNSLRVLQQRLLRGSVIVDAATHPYCVHVDLFSRVEDHGPYRHFSGDLDPSSFLVLASDGPLAEVGISLLDQSTPNSADGEAYELHARIADLEQRVQDLTVQKELAVIQADFLRKRLADQRD